MAEGLGFHETLHSILADEFSSWARNKDLVFIVVQLEAQVPGDCEGFGDGNVH